LEFIHAMVLCKLDAEWIGLSGGWRRMGTQAWRQAKLLFAAMHKVKERRAFADGEDL
jgi:hypothetical protein